METPAFPRLNEPAPKFTAKTTKGELSLDQFKGQWVILFSHPADFTPVCTTEFVELAKLQDHFKNRNVQLIGVSVDSIYAHLAWIRNIEQHFGVKIDFPVVADLDMKVANTYGMIHPGAADTSTVRCVFVIDPDQNVRAMIYYPLTTGRNIDEIVRLVDALQLQTAKKVATPANWRPGEKVIIPAPITQEDADRRSESGYEYTDWYFSKAEPPA